MAVTSYALTQPYALPSRRGPITRLLEDERWLALVLLLPTVVLLLLFIAYPFAKGVELSVTDAKVGVPGSFVGLRNFAMLASDTIFREAVWNTFVYTGVTTVFKLALGLWLALLLNRHFRGKAVTRAFILLPFIIPTVLSTFAWKWMFDPTFSVINWTFYRIGLIHGRIAWLSDPDLAMLSVIIVNVWRGVPFYAISLLAGLQTINPELHMAALLARDLAAASAGNHGGGAVLDHPDLCRLPACVRADRRRARQCHAAVRDLRLSDRRRDRPVERGSGGLACHVSCSVDRGHSPTPLHTPGGDAVGRALDND
jgi:ABC-type spermidine/putrescine transport system permease subunit I